MKRLIAICVVIVLCCSSTTVFALQKQSINRSDDNKTISQSNFDDSITMLRDLSKEDNFIFRILDKIIDIIPNFIIILFLLLT